ncbi:hypothetical protein BH11BAC2_BH11BAC2_09390 [soil metagenome]
MKKIFLILLFIQVINVDAQTWSMLPNSPSSTSFRHDDLFFINKDTGWVCNVDGEIYRTLDSGITWTTQLNQPNTSFHCIGFKDFLYGWAGNLGLGR